MLTPVVFSKRQAPQPRLSVKRAPGRQSDRFWTEDEERVLRDHYATLGAAGCQEKLPRRTIHQIYAHANAMGLKAGKLTKPRRRHQAPDALDQQIREAWPGLTGRGAVQIFADSINVPSWLVSKRAAALGLTVPHRKEPPWTAAEEVLLTKVPLHDPRKCTAIFAEHGFKRTPTSIVVKATRKGLSRRFKDALSARAAAAILGIDDKWITARCIDGRLEAHKRGTARLVQQGGDTWSISPEALRRFVIENLDEIDIRKVEKFAFVHLLTGAYPAAEAIAAG